MRQFYICRSCGNVITKLNDSGVEVVCCGENMELLTVNTVDASVEKHVPIVSEQDGKLVISVGSEFHPMAPEHYIMWVFVETNGGGIFKYLKPGSDPTASFTLTDENYVNVFAYCNLHGLWAALK